METYIVIYETSDKEADFKKYLKSLSGWGRLTDNSWAVVTSKSASQIRDDLVNLKSQGDRIVVVRSGYIAAWSNARASNDWLKKNL